MKKVAKLAQRLDGKPRPVVTKICFACFLLSFVIGFSSGLVFRQLRLNLLMTRQKVQEIEEGRRLERLFERFSQKKGELEGAKPPPVKR